jgi:hypothetical protein
MVAPTIKFFCLIVPAGSSSTECAFFTGFMKRQGCKFSTSSTISPFLLMNNTSIEKCIKYIWIELQGMIQSPSSMRFICQTRFKGGRCRCGPTVWRCFNLL